MNVHDDMSDTEVLTAARDFLSAMPLGGPPDVEAIMAGGRARRRRRLIPGVTGTLAVAAAAALAVTALVPGSHQAIRQPSVHLAAWTVTEQSNGDITVIVRELEDPAGLQSMLRADGVPASVTFLPKLNPACQSYPGGKPTLQRVFTPLLEEVFPKPYRHQYLSPQPALGKAKRVQGRSPTRPGPPPGTSFIVIDPSALPGNAGVQLGASPNGGALLLPQLVYTSPKCTGS
jgi:hypothetical protein